jgi:hypothetical protein
MIQRKFRFTSALISSGWQKNVVVSVDEAGMITLKPRAGALDCIGGASAVPNARTRIKD